MINPQVEKRIHGDGIQKLYRFDNGYGLSVVKHEYSYGGNEGLWEVAPLLFNSNNIDDWRMCGKAFGLIDSDDVEGWLTEEKVEEWVELMSNLSPMP